MVLCVHYNGGTCLCSQRKSTYISGNGVYSHIPHAYQQLSLSTGTKCTLCIFCKCVVNCI